MMKDDLSFENFLINILSVLEKANIDYMIGGAIAVWPWGEPRTTQDIDMVISLSPEASGRLSAELEKIEIYLPTDIILENLFETRADLPINAIHGASGYKAEFFPIRPNDTFRKMAFERRRKVDFGSDVGKVYVHSPEDLIVYKIIYYSLSQQTKHIRDIASILETMEGQLDLDYIDHWVNKKGLVAIWREIKNELVS